MARQNCCLPPAVAGASAWPLTRKAIDQVDAFSLGAGSEVPPLGYVGVNPDQSHELYSLALFSMSEFKPYDLHSYIALQSSWTKIIHPLIAKRCNDSYFAQDNGVIYPELTLQQLAIGRPIASALRFRIYLPFSPQSGNTDNSSPEYHHRSVLTLDGCNSRIPHRKSVACTAHGLHEFVILNSCSAYR